MKRLVLSIIVVILCSSCMVGEERNFNNSIEPYCTDELYLQEGTYTSLSVGYGSNCGPLFDRSLDDQILFLEMGGCVEYDYSDRWSIIYSDELDTSTILYYHEDMFILLNVRRDGECWEYQEIVYQLAEEVVEEI